MHFYDIFLFKMVGSDGHDNYSVIFSDNCSIWGIRQSPINTFAF